jgi:ring-1,2-phenylacetyl-CoA epoxidase subunit PaaD
MVRAAPRHPGDMAIAASRPPGDVAIAAPRRPGEGRDLMPETHGAAAPRDPGLRGVDGIWEVLNSVPDPEIPVVSIIDLGIVREVGPDKVLLTPTYTGCPATQVIETMVREALDAAGYRGMAVETVLSPPWTTEWISEEGKRKLEAYGIAPPGRGEVRCPQCGSGETEEISRFGSTPCKALWRCRACAEPFDLFKCH